MIKNLGRALLVFTLFLSYIHAQVSVATDVNKKSVVKNEPITVQIKVAHEPSQKVNFQLPSRIEGAVIENKDISKQHAIRIINGNAEQQTTTTLTLQLLPQKSFTVPPIPIQIDGKHYQSQAVKIIVDENATATQSNTPLRLEMRADKEEVVIGEPIKLQITLYSKEGLQLSSGSSLDAPKFEGFNATQVGGVQKGRSGRYIAQTITYILTPYQSGAFTIEPAKANIGLIGSSDSFGLFDLTTHFERVISNPLTIRVLPKPQDVQIIGSYKLHTKISGTTVDAGEPVELQVTLQGEGDLSSFEMESYTIDGVTIYDDEAKVSTQVRGNKIIGRWQKRFVFIADRNFTIPTRTIKAYDPHKKSIYTLTVPPYTISVKGSTLQPLPVKDQKSDTAQDAPQESNEAPHISAWWQLLLAFIAGALSTFLLLKLKPLIIYPKFRGYDDALYTLLPYASQDKEVEKMVELLWQKKKRQSVTIDKKRLKALLKKYSV